MGSMVVQTQAWTLPTPAPRGSHTFLETPGAAQPPSPDLRVRGKLRLRLEGPSPCESDVQQNLGRSAPDSDCRFEAWPDPS